LLQRPPGLRGCSGGKGKKASMINLETRNCLAEERLSRGHGLGNADRVRIGVDELGVNWQKGKGALVFHWRRNGGERIRAKDSFIQSLLASNGRRLIPEGTKKTYLKKVESALSGANPLWVAKTKKERVVKGKTGANPKIKSSEGVSAEPSHPR